MESLTDRLRARLSNPEKVIGRPGWDDPVISQDARPIRNANEEIRSLP